MGSCSSCPSPSTPNHPMPSPTLNLRNLTSTKLHLIQTTRIPAPAPPKPIPVTKSNLTNVSNLGHHVSHNLTSLLRRTPITTLIPVSAPTSAAIAAAAAAAEVRDILIIIQPYETAGTGMNLDEDTIRIEFEARNPHSGEISGKFRFEIKFTSKLELQILPLGIVGDMALTGVYHKDRATLAIVSNASLENWMGKLGDQVNVARLSMPGTHNSPTCHTALPSVRCQAVSVTEQLRHGVRFLDIRVQPGGKELELVHGAFPIALSGKKLLKDVMNECYAFLDRNRTETIIVSLKREGTGKTNDQSFSKDIKRDVIDKRSGSWFTEPRIPKLGEARGKCILFRRYDIDDSLRGDNEGRGHGIDAANWAYNTPNYTTPSGICVQDFCEVAETENINKKVQYIKEHLERSCEGILLAERENRDPPLFVNFLSASNFWKVGCWPDRIAEKINPQICEHLAVDHRVDNGKAGTGVVIYDFVGDDGNWAVTKLVVGMNGGLLI
ncbi:PLC-like phosphodiesterase [Pyronema omphalodes]|nr:PLC-like phosphodiesterase [Pyronema omphalodes]